MFQLNNEMNLLILRKNIQVNRSSIRALSKPQFWDRPIPNPAQNGQLSPMLIANFYIFYTTTLALTDTNFFPIWPNKLEVFSGEKD